MVKPKPKIVHRLIPLSKKLRRREVLAGCPDCNETGMEAPNQICHSCRGDKVLVVAKIIEAECPKHTPLSRNEDGNWTKCKNCKDGWNQMAIVEMLNPELQIVIDALSA